jgi:hypothetical protein
MEENRHQSSLSNWKTMIVSLFKEKSITNEDNK